MSARPCFWPGCGKTVPALRLGCRPHWYALPKALRDRIWTHYQPGQDALTCSEAYRDALRDVLAYAHERNAENARQAARGAAMSARQERLF